MSAPTYDDNKDLSGFAVDETSSQVQVEEIDATVDNKLARKYDLFLIPALGLLYLLSFLDRGNIGNANVASPGITKTLGLTSVQYSASVSVVYATYIVFEPVYANLIKIMTPKILLTLSTLTWAGITIGTAFTKNYHQLIACRILLGATESGLFPCVAVYMYMTYTRKEIGRRMAYIYAIASMSGAFGGLIAYGLVHIDQGKVVGWQWLYIVEGILSFIGAPIAFFWIPNRVDQAWFLTKEEKALAEKRVALNKAHYNPDEQFSWGEVKAGILEWKTYTHGVIQFCGDITLYGMSTFMPAIIKGMGYSNVHAQLLTVPVYFVCAITFLFIGYFSDKQQHRSTWMVGCFGLQLIGYIILATVTKPGGRYVGVYFIGATLYAGVGLNNAWISGNVAGHYKRVTSFGIDQLIGNTAGAVIGFLYSSKIAPRYFRALYISIALTVLAIVLTIINALLLKAINKKRERLVAEGAADQPELGDRNPHFRFLL